MVCQVLGRGEGGGLTARRKNVSSPDVKTARGEFLTCCWSRKWWAGLRGFISRVLISTVACLLPKGSNFLLNEPTHRALSDHALCLLIPVPKLLPGWQTLSIPYPVFLTTLSCCKTQLEYLLFHAAFTDTPVPGWVRGTLFLSSWPLIAALKKLSVIIIGLNVRHLHWLTSDKKKPSPLHYYISNYLSAFAYLCIHYVNME